MCDINKVCAWYIELKRKLKCTQNTDAHTHGLDEITIIIKMLLNTTHNPLKQIFGCTFFSALVCSLTLIHWSIRCRFFVHWLVLVWSVHHWGVENKKFYDREQSEKKSDRVWVCVCCANLCRHKGWRHRCDYMDWARRTCKEVKKW